MEKAKVTSEQAERIKSYKEIWVRNGFETFMKYAIAGWNGPENKCLNKLTLEQQASAWINGYEVELTPHEKVLELYKGGIASEPYTIGKRAGIVVTLDILNITIEGING